jgi:LemA protein
MPPSVVWLLVLGAVLLVPAIWLIATYNRFIGLRQHLKESWADIDVELKRRHDLIPNLVETVKGYAAHEQQTLARVVELRNLAAAAHASTAGLAKDESAMMREVGRLLALGEAYPNLKADANFLALQRELGLTEDRIAASRRFYNANVRDLNQLRAMFPTSIVGSWMNIQEAEFFELASDAERVVPRIEASFTQPA